VVFVLDEVITGFRLSRGGAQVRWEIDPDLTTMAKIVAGGQPGGAVGGRSEIMGHMAYTDDPEWDRLHRVAQAGTFNAQPITAVAGIATLETIANEPINERADAMAHRLKNGLNEALIKNEVTGHAHGISSIVQVNLGADCDCDRGLCTMPYEMILETMPSEKTNVVRRAMYVNGVDMNGGRKFVVSSVHDEDVIDETIDAFDRSLRALRDESVV
jgi:glutamate-1-semialdehyde 2,1-aminomutase